MRSETATIGVADAVVQGRGGLTGSDSYSSFQIRLKKLSLGQAEPAHAPTCRARFNAEKLGVTNVSASFSRQILDGAILAIVVSFALIALYVTFRYRWRFAVPILRTLVNDIPIVLGVYAIAGREVSADTVAAVLTILGYSIYDTIIVFDRIRENMRLMPRASIATIANVSVSEVLKRSIVTSLDHAAPDRRALHLRRRDAAGLRFRDHGRHRRRRRLDDLHRDPAAGRADGARSRVREPRAARATTKAVRARVLRRAERAAREEPTPETPMDEVEKELGKLIDGSGRRVGRGEAGAPPPAPGIEAAWTTPLTTPIDEQDPSSASSR